MRIWDLVRWDSESQAKMEMEWGFPIMSLVIVSKIACQRNPVLSDPVVPRTFVVDCSSLVSGKQLLCFMHGQGYEKQQNHAYIHVHTYIS